MGFRRSGRMGCRRFGRTGCRGLAEWTATGLVDLAAVGIGAGRECLMRRCVIVAGAEIERYDLVRRYLKPDDFYICCDCGLRHREGLGILPDLIVGDFDSHENPNLDVETIVLPCEKDDTDTVFAIKTAVARGFEEFLLVGVIGGRLDHTLGNVSVLYMLDSMGKRALAVDDHAEMRVVSSETARIGDQFAYFSLLNLTGTAEGISITGAKYPLNDGTITCDYQYGISNEVLPGMTAEVRVKRGRLLLYQVRKQ